MSRFDETRGEQWQFQIHCLVNAWFLQGCQPGICALQFVSCIFICPSRGPAVLPYILVCGLCSLQGWHAGSRLPPWIPVLQALDPELKRMSTAMKSGLSRAALL